jgi:type I restriction enzyme S subunit
MSDWRNALLGEVCELKRGYDLPNAARRAGDVPIISSSGPTGFHDESKVRAPGVVTGRYGTLGSVFYVSEDFWPLNTALYVRDFKGNNQRYIAELLRSMNLGQYDGAAAVPGLNRNQLHKIPVRVPDAISQQAIASVAVAFDELIENNRRRVAVLEEMARAIYREWFVKFRYPGHEGIPLIESVLGLIPEGWSVAALEGVADITMGQSPSSEFYNSEGVGKPFHQGVADFGSHFPSTRKWCSIDGRSASEGDVLISVRAPVGRINVADTDITIGRGLSALRSKDTRQGLLLGQLREAFAEEDSMGNDGAIFKSLAELAALPILVAPDDIAAPANTVLSDNLDMIRVLSQSTDRLASLRDLILPKLVTGQIDISSLDLDALVGESA